MTYPSNVSERIAGCSFHGFSCVKHLPQPPTLVIFSYREESGINFLVRYLLQDPALSAKVVNQQLLPIKSSS